MEGISKRASHYDPSEDIREELEFDRREEELESRGYEYTEEDYEWGFGYDDGIDFSFRKEK